MDKQEMDDLFIDLSDLKVEEVEILAQEGSRGLPEFAASTSPNCVIGCTGSCSSEQ